MNNPFSLFESETNSLKDSMTELLEQLPNNSEQIKAIFKSLLLVHISKIKNSEERSTWINFIDSLDNFSHLGDQATFSFGQASEIDKEVNNEEISKNHFNKNIIIKALHSWKAILDIKKERKKALKCVLLIFLRLRYIESFWRWQMFSGGLDRIVSEFYKKKIYKKVLWAWNDIIYNPKDNIIEDKGYKYWAIKTMLIVFINWTSFIKDSYKLKKLTNSRRNFHCENTGKNSLSNSSSGNIEKKYFKVIHKEKKHKTENHLKYITKKIQGDCRLSIMKNTIKKWKKFVKYAIFGKKIHNFLRKNWLKDCFYGIKCWINNGLNMKTIKHIDSLKDLNDYELTVKITLLEQKLSSLNNCLLTEQIVNKSLLDKKYELKKLFNNI